MLLFARKNFAVWSEMVKKQNEEKEKERLKELQQIEEDERKQTEQEEDAEAIEEEIENQRTITDHKKLNNDVT